MFDFTLHELACLEAVVREGGFQRAGRALGRSHPSVHSAVGNLETQLDLPLLDRSGYRVVLTQEGDHLLRRIRHILDEVTQLQDDAKRLSQGEETDLRLLIGDLCPLPPFLDHLGDFFTAHAATRLHLYTAAITGPWQHLIDETVDLIFHHIDHQDPRIESIELMEVELLPVAAPTMITFQPSLDAATLRQYRQCILRDSNPESARRSYHLIPGSKRCTVPDQATKKGLICRGFAWGHLPRFLIEKELASGALISLVGEHLKPSTLRICAARLRERLHGPIARALWGSFTGFADRPST